MKKKSLAPRPHSTVLRANSLKVISKQDRSSISEIPVITSPHFDIIPQYEVVEHENQIDITKSIVEQTVKKQSPQVEKDEKFFMPFFEVDFQKSVYSYD
ncbi:hypothetical protein TVAG_030760 [Trichomonas vaginalis G3]|uniref:Uncharacterized protein n=1 Tax=Trichomonas vaginalis (strain ATCC PRA-98 / G3) TaxID=412133 RepID=A2EYI4_TRIV3|nr:hypothetical protein TVAGG3_0586190 [Trichomonas vaginalis G3]EAY02260.1 hypothetical protein TVAG_030760 [Trichomonas vaginalis G3]KAI5522912.1 hypothetical protein TVAGG3_0586190 [Trichomonas vaginalis G3]|eukprot:XP_001314577.1 hypothetical protein [Trichomonas vaginalis G3]